MSEELRDAVRAVLDAARTWRAARHHGPMDYETKAASYALMTAVREELEEILARPTEPTDGPLPWGSVIGGDEVFGADERWHRVTGVWTTSPAEVTVEIEVLGKPKRYRKDPSVPVRTRRHASPEVDAIAALEAAGINVSTILSEVPR